MSIISQAIFFARKDSSAFLLSQLFQNANGFLLSIVLVRQFGLGAVGSYTIAVTAAAVIASIGTLGLPFALARAEGNIGEKNTISIIAFCFVSVLSLPFIILFSFLVSQNYDQVLAIIFFTCGGWFFSQANIINSLLVLQGRAILSIVLPFVNFFGIFISFMFANTISQFAFIIFAFRILGVLTLWLFLPYERVSVRRFWSVARSSLKFLSADLIGYVSDQIFITGISFILSRHELGILGLCKQVASVAGTPIISILQAKYPALVADPSRMSVLRYQALWLSLAVFVLCELISIAMGFLFYDLPVFPFFAAILLAGMPAQYLIAVYETALKATGQVATINLLRAGESAFYIAIVPLSLFGVMPVLIALCAHTWCSSLITGIAASRRVSAFAA